MFDIFVDINIVDVEIFVWVCVDYIYWFNYLKGFYGLFKLVLLN